MENPELITLKNGLRIVLVDTGSLSLTTLLLVGAGSRYETEKNNGIAHFFEHMAFKGSKKYPSSFIISSAIEGLGGIFNAFTSKDHTGYWIKSTDEHFSTSIDVISDMVLNPILSPDEINRERGVITEEINMYEDMPQRRVGELYENLLYKGNPLGFDTIGTKKVIDSIKKQDFLDYINSLYDPANSVLAVSGGIKDRSKIISAVEEKFFQWKNTGRKKYIKISEKQGKLSMMVKSKDTEQAHFCLGFRTFSFNDKRKYVQNVLSVILGGGMSSRLFINVRERKGLCYYISTGSEFYDDCGYFVTQAGVAKDVDKVNLAIKAVIEEHMGILSGNIKPEELVRAKELIKGRLMLSFEDTSNVANFFANKLLLQGQLMTPQAILKKIDEVTINDIVDLAKEFFSLKKLNMALIGPLEKDEIRMEY